SSQKQGLGTPSPWPCAGEKGQGNEDSCRRIVHGDLDRGRAMPYREWLTAYSHLVKNGASVCPACEVDGLRICFIGDPKTRMGWAAAWCPACGAAARFSRVKVPEGATLLRFEDPMPEELLRVRWVHR